MQTLLEYECPCCGGKIEFDSTVQKMKCPYCDTEFDVEAMKDLDRELEQEQDGSHDHMNWDEKAGQDWQEGEEDGFRCYTCQSCGGEIIGDETMAATSCPFCGNPVVIMGQFRGALKPDWVIPFKLDKKAAKEGLRQHLKGKRLLPRVFRDENHIDEIQGIYVPFWLFDADADANVRYRATKVQSWSDSEYNYVKTSYYSVHRGGSIGFARVPVDGSSKMEDDLMESIEPYDFSDAVEFQTAYLSGYLADKYDVSERDSEARANARIQSSTEQAMAETVTGYNTVVPEATNIYLKNSRAQYALYPVWILNTTWHGKQYRFAMNGQTGKFVGNLPLDKGAYTKWLLGLTGGISAALFGIASLGWLFL